MSILVNALSAPLSISDVDGVRFTPVRLREGYDMGEVDQFLDRIAATMRGERGSNAVSAADVESAKFSPVRIREGYDMGEVDTFLDLVVETLNGTPSSGGSDGASAAPSSPAPGPDATTVCSICFVPIRVADEDGHRGWHVSLLARA